MQADPSACGAAQELAQHAGTLRRKQQRHALRGLLLHADAAVSGCCQHASMCVPRTLAALTEGLADGIQAAAAALQQVVPACTPPRTVDGTPMDTSGGALRHSDSEHLSDAAAAAELDRWREVRDGLGSVYMLAVLFPGFCS